MDYFALKTCVLACILGWPFLAVVSADEIVISGNEHTITIGDFDFAPCNAESFGERAGLQAGDNGEVTAGELWQYFADRGFQSVESLTICMDCIPATVNNGIDVSGLQLQIEAPDGGAFITDASLGSNSIIVPDFEISPLKPEARLDVTLGYDFMRRFSPESKEIVKLNFRSTSAAGFLSPTFSFDSEDNPRTPSVNWFILLGFVAFWSLVFKGLSVATAQKTPAEQAVASNLPSSEAVSS